MASVIYNINRTLVSMSRYISSGEPIANECELVMENDKEVLIKLSSTVKEGKLTIHLLDEQENTVREFSVNDEEKESVTLKKGRYYMRADSDYFRGSYNIRIYD